MLIGVVNRIHACTLWIKLLITFKQNIMFSVNVIAPLHGWCVSWVCYGGVHIIQVHRGHSRNQPKGGRNSPQHCTATCFSDHYLSWHTQRVQKPLQRPLSAVFCTTLCLNYSVILVWSRKMTNFLSKNYFCSVQRVVLRPPRPIARMATVN